MLVLPGHVDDSKNIIRYLYNKYKDNIIIKYNESVYSNGSN